MLSLFRGSVCLPGLCEKSIWSSAEGAGLGPVIHSPPPFFGDYTSVPLATETRQSSLGPGGFLSPVREGLDLPLRCRVKKGRSLGGGGALLSGDTWPSRLPTCTPLATCQSPHTPPKPQKSRRLHVGGAQRKPAEGALLSVRREKPVVPIEECLGESESRRKLGGDDPENQCPGIARNLGAALTSRSIRVIV